MNTAAPGDGAAREAGFEPHRARLFGIAYRMLGSVADAEDAVQDAFLRWQRVDPSTVEEPGAYLSRTVSRLCLDQLRAARTRRESYVGPWLPDPLVAYEAPPPDDAIETAEEVSVALMLALERLTPLERAAFLLHDVFDQPFDEVAETLGRTSAACRQLAARARTHVRAAAPRREVPPDEGERLANAFAHAARNGDLDGLKSVLAEQAVLYSDGGGRVIAALNPVRGADRVARFFAGIARKEGPLIAHARPARINGLPGFVARDAAGLLQTMSFEIEDGRISAVYVQRNPDKLGHVASPG